MRHFKTGPTDVQKPWGRKNHGTSKELKRSTVQLKTECTEDRGLCLTPPAGYMRDFCSKTNGKIFRFILDSCSLKSTDYSSSRMDARKWEKRLRSMWILNIFIGNVSRIWLDKGNKRVLIMTSLRFYKIYNYNKIYNNSIII